MKKIVALSAILLLLIFSMGTGIADKHGHSETSDTVSEVTGETVVDEPSPSPSPPPSGGGGIMPSNDPPVAEAGPNRTVYVDVAIHFNGADSYDPDGTIEMYHWFFGDGGYESGVKVMHIYEEAGNYTVSLSITDNYGGSGSDNCTVTVHSMPAEPQALIFETVATNQTGYVVDALDEANTTVTLNTTDIIIVTVIKYESNPHPEDPMPAVGIPKYADIYVSDPDAVEWPIYVEMTYTDEDIEGLDEISLGIYYWFNGTWQRCSYTGVNTTSNVVWAYMTREEASGSPILIAGMHAITPPPLPPYLDNLNIEPDVVELGGYVTISFHIRNLGSQSINYGVDIYIENVNITRIWIQLGAYESLEILHAQQTDTVGTFNVTVHRMTGNFTVKSPPLPAEFVVSDLIITPEEVDIGEEVEISFTVTNIGGLPEKYLFTIGIEGPLLVVSKEMFGYLEAGESEVASYMLVEDVPGTYSVEVDGLKDSFEVKIIPSAGFVLSDLTITPEEIELGDEVTVSFVIRNADSRSFVYVPYVQIGETMIMDGVELEGHESRTVSHTMIPESVGDYEVEVDGLTGSFTVKPRGMQPGTIVVIIIVLIVAAAILYANWKGILPSLYPEIDDEIEKP